MRQLLIAALFVTASCQRGTIFHRIEVIDAETGRGVPMVELTPLNAVPYVTDSNGLIAFQEAHLMGQEIYFDVKSHGYVAPKIEGTDFNGVKLTPRPGARSTIKLHRVNLAERLYRLTGEGIYRDTILLGEKAPILNPLLNAQIMGTDGASTALYRGKIYWFFGDTNGLNDMNFGATAATSIPGAPIVELSFFTKASGFAKPMITVEGEGIVWPYTPMVLPDPKGVERLLIRYDRGAGLGKEPLERGLAQFNDEKQIIEPILKWDLKAKLYPDGIAFRVDRNGERFFYFANGEPSPRTRVRARWEDVTNPSTYEALTPIPYTTRKLRSSSIQWNPYRKKWIMLAQEIDAPSSKLGEIWYLDADQPEGPWQNELKILTHDRYAFYEVVQHPMLDSGDGRYIYFSGTYSDFLSNPRSITPRYDYNVLMYRLDLNKIRAANSAQNAPR